MKKLKSKIEISYEVWRNDTNSRIIPKSHIDELDEAINDRIKECLDENWYRAEFHHSVSINSKRDASYSGWINIKNTTYDE